MKRLFTFFLTFFVCLSLWGQGVPMTVVGDVYIDTNGKMESVGSVHLQAISNTQQARVENHGVLNMDSATVFYTNDKFDGLLMNKGTTTSDTAVVRKNFTKQVWYQMSFPFDVDVATGVINPVKGTPIVKDVDFYVKVYDSQKRAQTGVQGSSIWVYPNPDTITVLRKGVGYLIALESTRFPAGSNIDFVAKTPGDVTQLYSNVAKTIPLTWYHNDPNKPNWKKLIPDSVAFAEGWNVFGGLNSSYFLLNPGATKTYTYSSTVYYTSDDGVWKELTTLPVGQTGTLRPYATLFVQTVENGAQSFVFENNGLRLTTLEGPTLFRSSQQASSTDDIIGLKLINSVNPADSSVIYFRFGSAYSKDFKKVEDDFRLTTESKVSPIVWSVGSVGDGTVKYNLFVNSLPTGENEIPLGVNFPVAGDYVFSLKEFTNTSITSAVLYDNLTKTSYDLLSEPANIDKLGAINKDDRFVLYINKVITSLDPLPSGTDIYAFAENNILTVKNLSQGDIVQVFDLTGRIVASGTVADNTFTATLNQKGVYIVNVKGMKTLKVLNK